MWHAQGRREMHTGFWWGNLEERTTWKTWTQLGEYNKTDPKELGWKGVDWIDVSQDQGKWRAVVNRVTNIWVS